eukprot:3425583-Amphidinium_carterae.2
MSSFAGTVNNYRVNRKQAFKSCGDTFKVLLHIVPQVHRNKKLMGVAWQVLVVDEGHRCHAWKRALTNPPGMLESD